MTGLKVSVVCSVAIQHALGRKRHCVVYSLKTSIQRSIGVSKRRHMFKIEEFYSAIYHPNCGIYGYTQALNDNKQYIFNLLKSQGLFCFDIAHDKMINQFIFFIRW